MRAYSFCCDKPCINNKYTYINGCIKRKIRVSTIEHADDQRIRVIRVTTTSRSTTRISGRE